MLRHLRFGLCAPLSHAKLHSLALLCTVASRLFARQLAAYPALPLQPAYHEHHLSRLLWFRAISALVLDMAAPLQRQGCVARLLWILQMLEMLAVPMMRSAFFH